MDRRGFLQRAAAVTAAIPFSAFASRVEAIGKPPRTGDAAYGPLAPVQDETTGLPLLWLPAGFSYASFGWTGDLMSNGNRTPGAHDGMAAFRVRRNLALDPSSTGPEENRRNDRCLLVRNHELGGGTPFGGPSYDLATGGGTTTLLFDTGLGQVVETYASLSGTRTNCAGGLTPSGSWLTCEETTAFTTVPHGYVFEVPAGDFGDPEPIRDMGRFSHEAVAVDPATGLIYLTEDAGFNSGLYMFMPKHRKLSRGGVLFMLKVKDVELANLGASYPNGTTFDVEWVTIDTPDNPSPTMPGNFVWAQGRAQGAATFARLEGMWYSKYDGLIYIVSTNGGIGQGQIWVYDPCYKTITLLFQSPGPTVLNAPDNITVSPRGGLVLCEDGSGEEFMHGLTTDGEIFQFAKNNVVLNGQRNGIVGDFRGAEFAGACYSPDGKWLFANIQSPGITFAITGPWHTGAL